MILAMAAFAVADSMVKSAVGQISPGQVMFVLIGGGLVFFSIITKLQGEPFWDVRVVQPVFLLRYMSEAGGMIGMISALTSVPLSTVGAVLQATPLIVALGAVLFLGEKVSWRRWSAIAMGFVGVLLIIRPTSQGFDSAVLWAVLSMFCLSVRDLTTRKIPSDISSARLGAYTLAATLPVSLIWIYFSSDGLLPADPDWLMLLAMTLLGSAGYLLLITSLRSGDISTIAPFRYARLIFLLILGVIVFDERPDATMLIGAMIIVVSGLYMMWRERVVAKAGAPRS